MQRPQCIICLHDLDNPELCLVVCGHRNIVKLRGDEKGQQETRDVTDMAKGHKEENCFTGSLDEYIEETIPANNYSGTRTV